MLFKKADNLEKAELAEIQHEFVRLYAESPNYTVNRDDGRQYMTRIWYTAITNFLESSELKRGQQLPNSKHGSKEG